MQISAATVDEYLHKIPEDTKKPFLKLRQTILENLPEGFEEKTSYGMIGYVVPHNLYPAGYHVTPELPLPFVNIASRKNYIALYHMGIYSDKEVLDWFVEEYSKFCKTKLDMGKSCIRFKKPDDIPFALIGQLMQKFSVDKWIQTYESHFKKQ